MIGKIISHYKIIEKIGSGGMGVVYKAQDLKLDRFVAIKFLPPSFSSDEEAKQRFIHEAKAASTLQHNNICTIHEIDETDDEQLFICMDYYEGETLKEKIKDEKLKIKEILDYATQIAQGLASAHEKGIIHRDINPANILITDRNEVIILDFGLAKSNAYTKITKMDSTKGTIAYLSPEQAKGKDATHQSDIWALGVMMYEMLTGHLPFKGEYDQVLIYSILDKEPEKITSLNPDIPVELTYIMSRALEKDLDSRYQNIEEMLIDLLSFKKNSTISSDTESVIQRKEKRKRLKTAIISGTIILFAAVMFYLIRSFFLSEVKNDIPTTLAVISFENQTGDSSYNYLQKAIPNLLITNLEQSRHLQVTTWERMHDLLKQIDKEEVDVIDKELGFELCGMDGIDAIVLGSFVKAGDVFATDVKVLDVVTKKLLKSANTKSEGLASILESQIDYLSEEIAEGIGLSPREIKSVPLKIADVTTTSMEAYNYFLRGREDYEKWYYVDARKFLEKAIELDSTFAMAYLYLAWTYDAVWNNKAKDEAYKKAKAFSGKASEKERLYIEAYYARTFERSPEKKFLILKQIAKKYPKEKRVHYFLGSYFKSRNLFNDAIAEYNQALELDPNYGIVVSNMAYIFSDLGEYEKAIEYFGRYASILPGDADPFVCMGDLYFQMGRLDEARAKYKEAIEVKPDFYISYLRIGYLCALTENYPEAMNWIDQYIAIAQSPGSRAEGLWHKGFYHYWLGGMDIALNDFQKVIDMATMFESEALKNTVDWMIGCIYYDKGEYELSRSYFKKWIDLRLEYFPEQEGPFNTAAYKFYLGMMDLNEEQVDSAKSRLVDIKYLMPEIYPADKNLITAYYNLLRAEILYTRDSIEQVITDCEEAKLSEMPGISKFNMVVFNIFLPGDVLARSYLKNGELNRAINEYKRLTNSDPNSRGRLLIHPNYHYRLAKLYEQKGWMENAIEQYEIFLKIWKDADKNLPEFVDAKKRLANLTKN
jgi:serine/threonine protein kinase/tetratricopeptide (TPR) repeat protein